MLILLAALIGGALYWFRGRGGWGLGTQGNRLVWSLPTGAVLWWATGMPVAWWCALTRRSARVAGLSVIPAGCADS